MTIKSSPLYRQGAIAKNDDPNQPKPTTMKGGGRMFLKREGLLMEDFTRRSSRNMELPRLPLPRSIYIQDRVRSSKINSGHSDEMSESDSPTNSIIEGALEVMDYDVRINDDNEDDSDVESITIPTKTISNSYVKPRTRALKAERRRNELLMDNALTITDALRVIQSKEIDCNLSSGDEESLDPGDIDFDDGYNSDLL